MKKLIYVLTLLLCFQTITNAQVVDEKKIAELKDKAAKETDGWKKGGSFGFDASALSLVNPRFGAGGNRISLGGLGSWFANQKKGKMLWQNTISGQLAVQRLGSEKDFTKQLDLLRYATQIGYSTKNPKIYYGIKGDFETLITPTYAKNYLKPKDSQDKASSRFFSPARIKVGLGVGYKVDDHLSFFFAPASIQAIIVSDKDIAALNIHGNDVGSTKSIQGGAQLTTRYNNKFLKDKLVYSSNLDLFTSYNHNPGRIDVLWKNDLGVVIFKNISLNYLLEAAYDDDVMVQVDRANNGIITPGKATSFTSVLLLKYNYTF
jgi:hypothetical protein